MSRESLGHFELLVMLALLRQGDDAYGVPIADAIAQSTGKPVILASVYNTLERLEQKGLVRSTLGQPTPERGGRAKRYFSITTPGLREVRAAKKALTHFARMDQATQLLGRGYPRFDMRIPGKFIIRISSQPGSKVPALAPPTAPAAPPPAGAEAPDPSTTI